MRGRGTLEGDAGSWLSALPACDLGKVTFSELVFPLCSGILIPGWVRDIGF